MRARRPPCEPVRAGVEVGGHLAQRLEYLGGEHDGGEARGEVQVAMDETHAHDDGHEGDGDARDELEDRPGEEGDPQGPQGGRVVRVRQHPDAPARSVLPPQRLQSGQTRQEVQDLAAETLHHGEPLLGVALRQSAHQPHEEGDQREREEEDEAGREVDGEDHRERHG